MQERWEDRARARWAPVFTAGSQLAQHKISPSHSQWSMCGNSVAGSLPKSPTSTPGSQPTPSPTWQPGVMSLPWRAPQVQVHRPGASAALPAGLHMCAGLQTCEVQLLTLLAGVLAFLTSPVKMKESFENQSSDSNGKRKSFCGLLSLGFWDWGMGNGCLLCPSTSSLCLFILLYPFIHLSNPHTIIGVSWHTEVNVAPSQWVPNK